MRRLLWLLIGASIVTVSLAGPAVATGPPGVEVPMTDFPPALPEVETILNGGENGTDMCGCYWVGFVGGLLIGILA